MGEMKGTGFRQEPAPLLQKIGDVLAAVRAQGVGVVERLACHLRPVNLAQRDYLLHVMADVEAPLGQMIVIDLGLGREAQEREEQPVVPRVGALAQQLPGVVGVLEVAPALVAAQVLGNEFVAIEQPQPLRVELERQRARGVPRRNRVAVGVDHHPPAVGDVDRPDDRAIVGRRQRLEPRPLLCVHVDRAPLGLGVQPHVGHPVQPQPRRRVDRRKLRRVQAGQEVALHISDPALDPAFSLGMVPAAGFGLEAVMPGEVEVARIEHSWPAGWVQ